MTCIERPALDAREHRLVHRLRVILVGQDEAAARAAQRLVRGGRHDVAVRHRARVQAGDHEARDVRDVGEQQRADLVGDGPERREVERCAGRRSPRRRSSWGRGERGAHASMSMRPVASSTP
jgi:hypothetical protein